MAKSTPIESRQELHEYLQAALQLEHATIPPYISALYSIHPGTNLDGYNILRVVAIEEMLHLTLVANLLNAVGGIPDLTRTNFVPDYPAYLPTGQVDFEVGLLPFSTEAIDTFLNIERPEKRPGPKKVKVLKVEGENKKHRKIHTQHGIYYTKAILVNSRQEAAMIKHILPVVKTQDEKNQPVHLHFYSIGEFYLAIQKGIEHLCETLGETELFCGDPARQIGSEYFFNGGGTLSKVTDKQSAIDAMELISEQGEGYEGGIYDEGAELSHYYRFQQLHLGKYYQENDRPDHPTGADVNVNWDAVYPIKPNAKVADFSDSPELTQAARAFNTVYKNFLAEINEAFNGQPEKLRPAIGGMFQIKAAAERLMHNPMPGQQQTHAAPTFQMSEVL